MEPQIRYVRSADGTRIAMWTLGQGRPLVNPHSIWWTSMESFWHIPQEREGIEEVAKRRTVVRFDNRGHGMSEREVSDFSLGARVSDLTAVINHLGVPVDLVATGNAGPTAIAFTAANPDMVRRLVLRGAVARALDRTTGLIASSLRDRALRQLREADWEAYVRTTAALTWGWNEVGLAVGAASIDSVAPETFVAAARALREYDVTDLLSEVRCPTLVMFRKGDFLPERAAQHVASAIPNARLVRFDQEYNLAFGLESRQIIEAFLDEEDDQQAEAPPLPSGTAVILFADIADSTALTERLGDAAFRARARELGPALRALIRECAGTPIEGPTLGDGVLAAFSSAREAIEAALRCGSAADALGLPLHLGLHAGDITREQDPDGRDNVYGGAVNIAARISGLSAPGEVLVSDTVRSLARTSAGVTFEDRGEQALKGVSDAVRVYAVTREG